jgi:hypothetical protein
MRLAALQGLETGCELTPARLGKPFSFAKITYRIPTSKGVNSQQIHSTNSAACWTGLLRYGAARCVQMRLDPGAKWLERANQDIQSEDRDDVLGPATRIAGKLESPEYGRWLRKTVDALRLQRSDVLEALVKLDRHDKRILRAFC